MKALFISLISIFLFSCKQDPGVQNDSLSKYIPDASSYIVRTSNFDLLKTQLKNNSSFKSFIEKASFKNSKSLFEDLNKISSKGPAIVCLREIGKNSIDFIFISSLDQSGVSNLVLKSSKSYDNNIIKTYSLPAGAEAESLLHATEINSTLLISSSLLMIENALRLQDQNKLPKDLAALFKTSKEDAIFARLDQHAWLAKNGFISFPTYHFGAWSALHYNIEPEQLSLNGFNTYSDSLPAILNLFKDSQAAVLKSPGFVPQNTQQTKIYALSNYEDFRLQQSKLLDKSTETDTLFKHIEELALSKSNNRFTGFFHFTETSNIQSYLTKNDPNPSEFRAAVVYDLQASKLLKESFRPLTDSLQINYASLLGQTLIVAQNPADIQTAISSIETGATLSKDPYYSKSQSELATQSSILFYESFLGNTPKNNITDYFIPNTLKKNEAYTKSSQWVVGDGFFHQHTNLSKHTVKEEKFSLRPLFNLELDAPIGQTIQWVKNHLNQEYDILLQDKNHYLYLINNKGKVLWRKQLESAIQGEVHQVDIYKNGRLQLAFTTENQWLILDRNGKEVLPFNKRFKGIKLGPLAVFDYDNHKEYRFVFSQGKNINMYDRNGKIVKGFRFKKADSDIVGVPKHFKIKSKDYLVFKTLSGDLLIKNRVGNTRVKLSKKFNFSDNEPMLLDGEFSFTDLDGKLIQIKPTGITRTKNLRINAAHKTTQLNNQLVVLEDNILYSKGKKATIDFGIYSHPSITEVNKETFISITDSQNEKVYLFNKELEGIPKFPIYGTGAAKLQDMNGNGELNILCQQNKQTIVVYGMKTPSK